MWMSEVEMNVWMRGLEASLIAPQAASMSALWVRARPHTTGPSTSRAMAWTASKSPGAVTGKPASITSTRSRASCWAISTFSCVFSEMPGDCSPSLSVVSKMWTRSWSGVDPGPLMAFLLRVETQMTLSVAALAPPSVTPPAGGGEGGAPGSCGTKSSSAGTLAHTLNLTSGEPPVDAARIQARAVVKVAAISLAVIAAALLLAIIVLHVRTEIRWLFAALFLALAMNPAVDRVEGLRIRGHRIFPRWLAILVVYVLVLALFVFLILQVVPPIIREFEHLGSKVPGYVHDFRQWANQNQQFQELNHKYNITLTLSQQASTIPSKLGGAASDIQTITVSILEHLLAAITILALTFFLLLDGRQQGERALSRMEPETATRWRRIATRIAGVVKSYVSVNLLLAIAAGVFTWLSLELLGVDLAVTMGVIVGFLDLVALIGWVALFLVYQQVQDRVIQPLLYKSAVRVHPAVAIMAILVGGELAGILGALLAIPTAATIGVLIDETLRWRRETSGQTGSQPADSGPSGAAQPEPAAD